MEFTVEIINRDQIQPTNYVANTKSNNQSPVDNTSMQITKIKFQNGLTYYMSYPTEVNYLEFIRFDYEKLSHFQSAKDIQKYYIHNLNLIVNFSDCEKIFNYYQQNQNLIVEFIQNIFAYNQVY